MKVVTFKLDTYATTRRNLGNRKRSYFQPSAGANFLRHRFGMASHGIFNNEQPKKVHWKWTNQACDEYGNIEIVYADPPSSISSPSPDPNRSTKLNLRFTYPFSSSSKLPPPPPSPILQPLCGDADVEPLGLCNNSDIIATFSIKPALKTPYPTPQILHTISGVYTPYEWSHERVLARIEASKPSTIMNVSFTFYYHISSNAIYQSLTLPRTFQIFPFGSSHELK